MRRTGNSIICFPRSSRDMTSYIFPNLSCEGTEGVAWLSERQVLRLLEGGRGLGAWEMEWGEGWGMGLDQ